MINRVPFDKIKKEIFQKILGKKYDEFSKLFFSFESKEILKNFCKIQFFLKKLNKTTKIKLTQIQTKYSFAKTYWDNKRREDLMKSKDFQDPTFPGDVSKEFQINDMQFIAVSSRKELSNCIWFIFLIEYSIFKDDKKYFSEKIDKSQSWDMKNNELKYKIRMFYLQDFENTVFLYGNGLNNFLDIEWINEKKSIKL